MARVPESERWQIVRLCMQGMKQRDIARLTKRPIKTVNRIIQAYRTERRIKDAPRKPRSRVTSLEEDLNIVAVAAAKPGASVREIRQMVGVQASKTTIKRRLHEAGLKSRIAAQKPLLRVANKEKKVAVCSRTHVLDDTKLGEGGLLGRMHLHDVLGPEGSCLTTRQQPVSSLWLINLVIQKKRF